MTRSERQIHRMSRLEASPGDLVIVQLTKEGGPGVACLSVFRPDGALITPRGCTAFTFAPVRFEFRDLTARGAYTIRVDERNFNAIFEYSLFVDCIGTCSRPPDFPGFPTVTLRLTGCMPTCAVGDVFSVGMFLNNPAPNSGELKLTYIRPDMSLSSIGDPHREVPLNTRIEDEEIVNEPITREHPPGMWRVCGQLLELRRGRMLSANCQTFEIRPQ